MDTRLKLNENDRELWESKARWCVTLSNGLNVYRNDEQIGTSSWVLLRNFLLENPEIKIVKMFIGFRDNTVALPDNADGYYFRNSVIGSLSGSKSSFLAGVLEDNVCKVGKWEIPEMQFIGNEIRPLEEAGESLIVN